MLLCKLQSHYCDTEDLPQLEGADPAANGTMFEKYADNSTNAAGGGGEYEVVEGFGWSNGVLIWMGDVFGEVLKTPECGNITAAVVNPDKKRKRSAVELGHYDSKFVKRWQR
jgi:alpha,alpha-trehalase